MNQDKIWINKTIMGLNARINRFLAGFLMGIILALIICLFTGLLSFDGVVGASRLTAPENKSTLLATEDTPLRPAGYAGQAEGTENSRWINDINPQRKGSAVKSVDIAGRPVKNKSAAWWIDYPYRQGQEWASIPCPENNPAGPVSNIHTYPPETRRAAPQACPAYNPISKWEVHTSPSQSPGGGSPAAGQILNLATEDTLLHPADYAGQAEWLDKLIDKIWQVESSGRLELPDGDSGDAIGPLQIHKEVLIDINHAYGTNFGIEDCRDIQKAKIIARLYINRWMDEHKEEIAARIFNGGPRGWERPITTGYWSKIKNQKAKGKSDE
jgi:hypothetical protein